MSISSNLAMINTIISGNTPVECDSTESFAAGNSNNLIDDNSCNLRSGTNFLNTDPLLGSLADNGDNTKTHLPAKNSPAINAALDFSSDITYDQKNVKRPHGSAYDIGAVEVKAPCSSFFIKHLQERMSQSVYKVLSYNFKTTQQGEDHIEL